MKKIKKNYIYNVLYQLLLLLFPFFTFPYVSKVLGVENIGIYNYTFAITSYFIIFSKLGILNYGTREIAENKKSQKKLVMSFKKIYKIQFILNAIVMFIFLIFIFVFGREYKNLYIIESLFLISNFFDLSWFYSGMEDFKKVSLRNFFINILSLPLIFIFVKNENDVLIYAMILGLVRIISNLILGLSLGKYIKIENIFKYKINKVSLVSCLKGLLVLFVPILAINVYNLMDQVMLGNLNVMGEVGIYSSAIKILYFPQAIITPLAIILMPYISKDNKRKTNVNSEIKEKALYFTLWLTIACSFGLNIVAKDFVLFFLGNDYLEVVPVVCILSIYLFTLALSSLFNNMFFLPNHRDKEYIKTIIVGIPINLILNIILIPKLGAIGAAIATVISDFILFIYRIMLIKEEINRESVIYYFGLYTFAGMLMFFCSNLLKFEFNNLLINMLLKVIICSVVYFLITFKTLKKIIFEKN